jgi:hypothetical protein
MQDPLPQDIYSATPPETDGYQHIGLQVEWVEPIVTAVAVSAAVLIVALVAVCMGMA